MEVVLFIMMMVVPVFSLISFCMSMANKKRIDAIKKVVVNNVVPQKTIYDVEEALDVLEI